MGTYDRKKFHGGEPPAPPCPPTPKLNSLPDSLLVFLYINSILAIIYLNEQVLNKQVLKPD